MTLPVDPALTTWLVPLAAYVFGLFVLAVVVPAILIVGALITLPPLFRLGFDVLAIFGRDEEPS